MALALTARVGDLPARPAAPECAGLGNAPPGGGGSDVLALHERCAADDPNDLALAARLGALYESAGKSAQAEAVYRHVLMVEPHDAEVRLRLARILLARHETQAAIREAQTVLTTRPNDEAALAFIQQAVAADAR